MLSANVSKGRCTQPKRLATTSAISSRSARGLLILNTTPLLTLRKTEIEEPGASGRTASRSRPRLERQPSIADAAGAGQGEERCVGESERASRRLVATDERVTCGNVAQLRVELRAARELTGAGCRGDD